MRAETKATSIPPEVKKAVYIRDNGFCVLCGSPYGDPVAHVVRRSQGGEKYRDPLPGLSQSL